MPRLILDKFGAAFTLAYHDLLSVWEMAFSKNNSPYEIIQVHHIAI